MSIKKFIKSIFGINSNNEINNECGCSKKRHTDEEVTNPFVKAFEEAGIPYTSYTLTDEELAEWDKLDKEFSK